jgi:anthranilate phosphoribosyltransferase
LNNQPGPALDIVVLNAGVALYAANVAPTMAAGLQMAKQAIANGLAQDKLTQFTAFTNRHGSA